MKSYCVNNYEIKIKSKDNLKKYMPLMRYFINLSEENFMPEKIYFKQDYSKIIDLEVLAKNRIGLIHFKKLKQEVDKVSFKIVNESDTSRYVYANELETPEVKPINPLLLLLKLPAKSKIQFEIEFSNGNGIDHARFSRLEGYRLKSKDGYEIIEFQITNDQLGDLVSKTLQNLQKYA